MTVNSADCLTALQERSGFCEEWQQHKKVKSVEVNEASPDTFNEGIHQSPNKLFIKIRTSSWSAYIIPWNIWYNQKKHLVQHKNNERLLNKNSIPFELHRHKCWHYNMINISQLRKGHCTNQTSLKNRTIT